MAALTQAQIAQLVAQGCTAEDWTTVTIAAGADLTHIRNAHFLGDVVIGDTSGFVEIDGVRLPCGIVDATIADCVIGAHVRIARIGSVVARYNVQDGAVIQDVASLTADAGSTFGAGVAIKTVNEAGGRAVVLLPDLSAMTAYVQVFRQHSEALRTAFNEIANRAVESARTARGVVGSGARLLHCGPLKNVHIGSHAIVHGVSLLENGTVLSCPEHPTVVGEGVQARHFLIAEGAAVTGGAMLDSVFIGQACKVGKLFSAEHSLFFANCELFHGEAVAVFGGPYTVTHHRGTLLIAVGSSFFNAGSGTNQSNHMYKLGPVHQGVFERGVKTGSFSYVLHETHVGAFSVVIGKHYANINTPDLPFSYIHERDGTTEIVPGMNLTSVGTARDAEKWPARDERLASVKRDRISFQMYSPYTVEKMRAGRAILQRLSETTPKEKAVVFYGGVSIKRLLFKNGIRAYAQGITRYLNGRVLERIQGARSTSWIDIQRALRTTAELTSPLNWTDVGGLLMPVERLQALESDIIAGACQSLADVNVQFDRIAALYAQDEWEYICTACAEEYGFSPSHMTPEQARELLNAFDAAATTLHAKVLDDSKKEFDAFAKVGYGLGMTPAERDADFAAVRGRADTNPVVRKLVQEQAELAERIQSLRDLLSSV